MTSLQFDRWKQVATGGGANMAESINQRLLRCSKPDCSHLVFPSIKRFLNHLRNSHSHEADFKVMCMANVCSQTFTVFSSFTSHLSRKHAKIEIFRNLMGRGQNEDIDDQFADTEEDGGDEHNGGHEEYSLRSLALYAIKTQELNRISDKALNDILDNTNSIFEQNLQSFQLGVKRSLQDAKIDINIIEGLPALFEAPSAMSKHETLMNSTNDRSKYFIKELGMMVRN
jgi:hypothetical protein